MVSAVKSAAMVLSFLIMAIDLNPRDQVMGRPRRECRMSGPENEDATLYS
jgi:hypothetical protein